MRPARRTEQGQATVEFALVVPIIVLVVLLLIQTVLFGIDAVWVVGAAREAVRAAAVGRDDAGVAEAAARGGGGLDPSRLVITTVPDPPQSGKLVTVTVTYRSRLAVPGLSMVAVSPPVLAAGATMLAE